MRTIEGRSTVYNRLTNDERVANINPENAQLCKDFLDYLSSVDRSPKTIQQYYYDLRIFCVFVAEQLGNKEFTKITKRELVRFQSYCLNDLKWSPRRMMRVKSAVSSMSNFIENILSDDDDIYADYKSIVKKIESPVNEPVREKTVMTDGQLELLLNTLVERKEYQKAVCAAILAYSGMRKAELLQMKMEYFEPDHLEFGSIYITDKVRAKGRGVRGKQIHKYILNKVDPYMDLWRKERAELGIESEWVFVTKSLDGTWHKRAYVENWKPEFSEIIGAPYYFHMNRHYCCTKMISDYNLPSEIVKEWQGWQDIGLISTYNDSTAYDSFGKYFTSDGIVHQEEKTLTDITQ